MILPFVSTIALGLFFTAERALVLLVSKSFYPLFLLFFFYHLFRKRSIIYGNFLSAKFLIFVGIGCALIPLQILNNIDIEIPNSYYHHFLSFWIVGIILCITRPAVEEISKLLMVTFNLICVMVVVDAIFNSFTDGAYNTSIQRALIGYGVPSSASYTPVVPLPPLGELPKVRSFLLEASASGSAIALMLCFLQITGGLSKKTHYLALISIYLTGSKTAYIVLCVFYFKNFLKNLLINRTSVFSILVGIAFFFYLLEYFSQDSRFLKYYINVFLHPFNLLARWLEEADLFDILVGNHGFARDFSSEVSIFNYIIFYGFLPTILILSMIFFQSLNRKAFTFFIYSLIAFSHYSVMLEMPFSAIVMCMIYVLSHSRGAIHPDDRSCKSSN